MREVSLIDLKVLQGKINDVTLQMIGPGEVLDVEGTHVAGWSVVAGRLVLCGLVHAGCTSESISSSSMNDKFTSW